MSVQEFVLIFADSEYLKLELKVILINQDTDSTEQLVTAYWNQPITNFEVMTRIPPVKQPECNLCK